MIDLMCGDGYEIKWDAWAAIATFAAVLAALFVPYWQERIQRKRLSRRRALTSQVLASALMNDLARVASELTMAISTAQGLSIETLRLSEVEARARLRVNAIKMPSVDELEGLDDQTAQVLTVFVSSLAATERTLSTLTFVPAPDGAAAVEGINEYKGGLVAIFRMMVRATQLVADRYSPALHYVYANRAYTALLSASGVKGLY